MKSGEHAVEVKQREVMSTALVASPRAELDERIRGALWRRKKGEHRFGAADGSKVQWSSWREDRCWKSDWRKRAGLPPSLSSPTARRLGEGP